MKQKVLCVVGTRPEAIKMVPLIQRLRRCEALECRVLATAQHREMLDQALQLFGVAADLDLDIMRPGQTLNALAARLLVGLDEVLRAERPDAVLLQGDTTTAMAAALACFHLGIPFGHVEAGLRTGDLDNPFPEEGNRLIVARLARWHFAPTRQALDNLLAEGVDPQRVHLTGNTVIDALLAAPPGELPALAPGAEARRLILVTAHRRENFGAPLQAICQALKTLALRNPQVQLLFPVHPNPSVQAVVYQWLGGIANVQLCAPLDYAAFVAAMKRAHFIISDSGGVQEEAPALGKPVLVLREETERPEALALGVVKLVGADPQAILAQAQLLLDDAQAYRAMARGVSPYGDGRAAERIVEVLLEHLQPQP